jgi:hypothetical protein
VLRADGASVATTRATTRSPRPGRAEPWIPLRPCSSTDAGNTCGARRGCCWKANTNASRSVRSRSRSASAPSRPTFKPAAGPARSGSGAWAADTSAPTPPTCELRDYLDTLLRDREDPGRHRTDDWARARACPRTPKSRG